MSDEKTNDARDTVVALAASEATSQDVLDTALDDFDAAIREDERERLAAFGVKPEPTKLGARIERALKPIAQRCSRKAMKALRFELHRLEGFEYLFNEMAAQRDAALSRTQPGQPGEVWTRAQIEEMARDAYDNSEAHASIGDRAHFMDCLSALLDAETKGGGK